MKNCTILIQDDSVFEPEEEFQVHLGSPQGDHWIGAMIGVNDIATVTLTNDEDGESLACCLTHNLKHKRFKQFHIFKESQMDGLNSAFIHVYVALHKMICQMHKCKHVHIMLFSSYD